jgi:hypothetical protein
VARIVRPMIKDLKDNLPLVGTKSKCLGVRESGPNADIDIDSSGSVMANRKGMSVSESWRTLPGHLIPDHLDDGRNGASGKNMAVFVHGQGSGAFAEGPLAPGLELCFKSGTTIAGNVCPVVDVPVAQYQCDLAATRAGWVVDES